MIQVIIANLIAGAALGYVMQTGGVPLSLAPWIAGCYVTGFAVYNLMRWLL